MTLFNLAGDMFSGVLEEKKHSSRDFYKVFLILTHKESTTPYCLMQLMQVIYATCRLETFPECYLKEDMRCDNHYAFIKRQIKEALSIDGASPNVMLAYDAFNYSPDSFREIPDDVTTRLGYFKI